MTDFKKAWGKVNADIEKASWFGNGIMRDIEELWHKGINASEICARLNLTGKEEEVQEVIDDLRESDKSMEKAGRQLRVWKQPGGIFQNVSSLAEARRTIDAWAKRDLKDPSVSFNAFGVEERDPKTGQWSEYYGASGEDWEGKSMDKAIVDDVLAWESGEMTAGEEVAFFQRIVNSGMVWNLQGAYGRRAVELIRAHLVKDPKNEVAPGLMSNKSMDRDRAVADRLMRDEWNVQDNLNLRGGNQSNNPKYIAAIGHINRSDITKGVMAILENENYHSLTQVLSNHYGAPSSWPSYDEMFTTKDSAHSGTRIRRNQQGGGTSTVHGVVDQ